MEQLKREGNRPCNMYKLESWAVWIFCQRFVSNYTFKNKENLVCANKVYGMHGVSPRAKFVNLSYQMVRH